MKCWNFNHEMEPREAEHHHPYELCPECGASHTELPKIVYSPIDFVHDIQQSETAGKNVRTPSPSRSLTRKVSIARSPK